MSWLNRDYQKYDTKYEVMDDFYQTVECEMPSVMASMQQLVCLGRVSSIEEAKKLIEAKPIESGLAYCEVVTSKVPKTTQDIMARRNNEEKKLMDYVAKNNCYNRKSATIGCKGCGSSLSTKHMAMKKLNKCPLCGTELRNDTVMKTIESYKTNIHKYEKQYAEATKKAKGKNIFYYGKGRYFLG